MRQFVPLRPGSRFGSIYRSGTRRRSGGITVLQAKGECPSPEVGVVAGKSVGNAVLRNRAKRRLREVAQAMDLQPHTAYVVVASRHVLDVPFSELEDWMRHAVAAGAPASSQAGNKDGQ